MKDKFAILRAGFFAGEFGWHLMRWQGIIRYLAQKYNKKHDRVIIGCENQYRFLYKDYATDFIDFPYPIESRNMWMTNDRIYPIPHSGLPPIIPNRGTCLMTTLPQKFIKFGKYDYKIGHDILFHARSTENLGTGYRNWSIENWIDLSKKLRKKRYSILSVGSLSESMYVDGTIDARGIELKLLADVMANSKLLVSPSSGTAHFASLCGLKHLVWAERKDTCIANNEKRYKTEWNPLKTDCVFLDGWKPDVNLVESEILKIL